MTETLIMAALGDVSGQVRGKAFPAFARDSRMRNGVGWTPTNVQITCFDTIADSPYGALGDLILRPDPATETVATFGPEVPSLHLVLGDVEHTDGRVWECCLRSMAKAALAELERETGLTLRSTFEHEFMFKTDTGPGGAFTHRGLQARRRFGELFLSALAEADLKPDSFLREYGRSQYEVTLDPATGITAADRALLLREFAHAAAAATGDSITFTPLIGEKEVGNGVHVHLSLWEGDRPATYGPDHTAELSPRAGAFVAGILKYAPAIVALTAPSVISYLRLTPHRWSAAFNNLGHRDREATIRVCPVSAKDEAGRARQFNVEYRAADAAANPHLTLAALVRAGLQGIREDLQAPEPTEEDLSLLPPEALAARGLARLPATLDEALAVLSASDTVCSWFPQTFIDIYVAHKKAEIAYLAGKPSEAVFGAYAAVY